MLLLCCFVKRTTQVGDLSVGLEDLTLHRSMQGLYVDHRPGVGTVGSWVPSTSELVSRTLDPKLLKDN